MKRMTTPYRLALFLLLTVAGTTLALAAGQSDGKTDKPTSRPTSQPASRPKSDAPKTDSPKTTDPPKAGAPTAEAKAKPKRVDPWVQRDRDGDGKWNRREFPGNDAAWKIADRNQDGFIDTKEWAQVQANRRGSPRRDARERRQRAIRVLRRTLQQDKDGDRRVSSDEFTGNAETFARLDINKDGWIDRKDLRAAQQRQEDSADKAERDKAERDKKREQTSDLDH